MKIINKIKKKDILTAISFLFFLSCWLLSGNPAKAYDHEKALEENRREYMSEYIGDMEDEGGKRTADGFFYTMDSNNIIKGFRLLRYYKGISKSTYKKMVKKYKGKKNCCYILSYVGDQKNIRLPEQIEGCSNYVLCFGHLNGMNDQVKNVTIPANVRILSVLQGNPMANNHNEWSLYAEVAYLRYYFTVEEGNRDVKSNNGLLYSKNGKILYGISRRLKGKLVVPDGVEKVYISYGVKISELVLGKNVSQIFIEDYSTAPHRLKKIKVKKGNRYFKAIDNTLYSKNMKKLYLSVSAKKGTYRMPDSVESMEKYAFSTAEFSKIITSDRLKKIPKGAFSNDSLKELVIGKNVSEIDETAIYRSNLRKICLDKNNPYFTVSGQWLIHTQPGGKSYNCGSFAEVMEK